MANYVNIFAERAGERERESLSHILIHAQTRYLWRSSQWGEDSRNHLLRPESQGQRNIQGWSRWILVQWEWHMPNLTSTFWNEGCQHDYIDVNICQPRLLDPSCLGRWASIPKRLMMHDWTTFWKLHPQLLQVLDCASKAFCLLGIRRLRTTRRTNCEKRLEWSTSHSRFQVNHGIHHNFYAELLGFVRSWFIDVYCEVEHEWPRDGWESG